MIKVVFFDLDNTLYDQMQYFRSGFAVISNYLSRQYALEEAEVYASLMTLHRSEGSMHRHLFDDLLAGFGLHGRSEVKNLIHLFHTAPVHALSLYEDAAEVLPRLAENYILGLITNGNGAMQRRKVVALNLNSLLAIQVYTADIACPKPSPKGFQHGLSMSGSLPAESMYVGDNPYTDFGGPLAVGMKTVRILRGEFKHHSLWGMPASMKVKDFYELEKQLHMLDSTA